MNRGGQLLAYLKNGIGAWSTVATGGLETPRVEHEHRAIALETGVMRVAVDHAVGVRENIKKSILDIKTQVGPMGQAYGKTTESEGLPGWIQSAHRFATHIAVDGNDLLSRKNIEYRRVGHIASVNDYIAVLKALPGLFFETVVRPDDVRIG